MKLEPSLDTLQAQVELRVLKIQVAVVVVVQVLLLDLLAVQVLLSFAI
jgi:hypothetical protein